jgi:hypothetical protein
MSHMSFCVTQAHRTYKTFKLGRFTCEIFANKASLGHHAFPSLPFEIKTNYFVKLFIETDILTKFSFMVKTRLLKLRNTSQKIILSVIRIMEFNVK